jgi:phosphate transport system substrate-binding protein
MKKFSMLLTAGLFAFAVASPAFAAKIVLDGSTTVLPIAQKAAEVYMEKDPSADISVRGGGSGVGIASLMDGRCDIANSSRPIKDGELDKAVMLGKEIKAHVIAMDGMAMIVNPANGVDGLTKKQVKDIYTGKVSDWADVGGAPGKIVVISRDSSSGTFEAFGELALNKEKVRPDAVMQASNQAIASIVSRTPGAIGYVGLAFMNEGVKAVTLDGVMPSKEAVLSNKYVYGRPLFMYTNGVPQGLVKDFIDFVKSAEGQMLVEEVGYVAIR